MCPCASRLSWLGHMEHMEALLAAGADWTIKNHDGETLRDIVAARAARPVDPTIGWTEEQRKNGMRIKMYLEVSS